MTEYRETFDAPCQYGHPAKWTATPDGSDYTCADCDTDTPAVPVLIGPRAWSFRSQMNRVRGMIA